MLRNPLVILLYLLLAAPLWAESLVRYEYDEVHMGVQVRLVVYASTHEIAEAGCTRAFARIAQLEDVMSDYRPMSELMRLCDQPVGKPVKVSDDLFKVLVASQALAEKTDGAFDVTVGPIVKLWRAARKSKQMPPAGDLAKAREAVGWQKLRLDDEHHTATLLAPNMQLDLGGIGKGFAGDEAIKTLKDNRLPMAMFEAGGDIVLGDAPPNEKGWTIEIEQKIPRGPNRLVLANCAISTSGDTQQFVEIGGQHYSHVVDPHTGLGLTNHFAATVVAPDGMTSDSLSTALTIIGEERGAALIKSNPKIQAWTRKVE
ncbi:MAG TPA: FAD:protein FMN transferase [Tepidisphaeraceae bacterium]|jgi:thiamine biosynthesis lipoprotein|nr:FAD:protein FMN transferase [Tepidisphaeraceae bacterium]